MDFPLLQCVSFNKYNMKKKSVISYIIILLKKIELTNVLTFKSDWAVF